MEVTNEAIKNAVKELFGNYEIEDTSCGIRVWIEKKDDNYFQFHGIAIWKNLTFNGTERYRIFYSYSKVSRFGGNKLAGSQRTPQRSGDVKKTIARLEVLAKTFA